MTEKPDLMSRLSSETKIDLGDDLVDQTAVIPGVALSTGAKSAPDPANIPAGEAGSIEDLLHSAKILADEGLADDAKKILRQILIIDSGNQSALEAAKRIQQEELKALFRDEVRPSSLRKSTKNVPEFDSEEVMKKLDRDLGLGIFSENLPFSLSEERSLFQNKEEIEALIENLEKKLATASMQDWIDLGIGFLEMEFHEVAVRLFSGACRKIESEIRSVQSVSATSLLAYTLIQMGRPFDAISKLQPLLRDVEIKLEQKVEIYYLMGRTYESLKKLDLARHFYSQVSKIDSRYRDVERRLVSRKQPAR
jgi:tetratricopeptide (TPR) repeat protein